MKKLFFAALAALALVGCQQEQSELNFSDIAGSATVKGKVLYQVGYTEDGSQLITELAPAANVEVVAQVNYSEYDDEATGVKQYTATTDENGSYEIVVPVTQKALSLTIVPRGFTAAYNGNTNSSLEILPTEAFFSHAGQAATVIAGDVKVLPNIEMYPEVEAAITSRNTVVNLEGKVLTEYEKATRDAANDINGSEYSTTAAKTTVNITLTYGSESIIYRDIKVNEEGIYTLKANVYDTWSDLAYAEVKVEAKAYLSEVRHYYFVYDTNEWRGESVPGLCGSGVAYGNLSNDAILVAEKMPNIIMPFTPTDKTTIKGIGNEIDYDVDGNRVYSYHNPMNW